MFETLTVERAKGYAEVTLNRPDVLNALSPLMTRELMAAFAWLENGPDVHAVIVTGARRAFCAGLDTRALASEGTRAFDLATNNVPAAFERFPGPVIAAVNGVAYTGGFEMSLACDVVLAAESASFVDGHSRIGLLPGWGLAARLQRIVGPQRAKYLSLSGRRLTAREAEQWGLVSLCVPDEELMSSARALAEEMVGAAPGILAPLKRLIDESGRTTLAEALANEAGKARAANTARGAALEIGRGRT